MNNNNNNDILMGALIGGMAGRAKAEKEKARAIEKKALLDNGYYEEYQKMVIEDIEIANKERQQAFWACMIIGIVCAGMLAFTFAIL